MIRIRTVALQVVVLVFALTAGAVWAHEDFRVIGTVTRHQASAIGVKKKDGTVASIRLDRKSTRLNSSH